MNSESIRRIESLSTTIIEYKDKMNKLESEIKFLESTKSDYRDSGRIIQSLKFQNISLDLIDWDFIDRESFSKDIIDNLIFRIDDQIDHKTEDLYKLKREYQELLESFAEEFK